MLNKHFDQRFPSLHLCALAGNRGSISKCSYVSNFKNGRIRWMAWHSFAATISVTFVDFTSRRLTKSWQCTNRNQRHHSINASAHNVPLLEVFATTLKDAISGRTLAALQKIVYC